MFEVFEELNKLLNLIFLDFVFCACFYRFRFKIFSNENTKPHVGEFLIYETVIDSRQFKKINQEISRNYDYAKAV